MKHEQNLQDINPNINFDFQLRTASWKIAIKYVGPVVVYKIIDPHNYLLMTLDGKILKGNVEHERLKLTVTRTNQGNVQNLADLKQIMNTNLKFYQYSF